MIRFLFILLLFLFAPNFASADDADFWDEPVKIDNAAKSQEKAVTDQEFNKVLNFFKKKTNPKRRKEKEKNGCASKS